MLFRKNETKSLLKESRSSLKNAEEKIEEQRQLLKIKDIEIESLKTKCAIYNTSLCEIKKLTNTQQFNSVINVQNKIKSVLDNARI